MVNYLRISLTDRCNLRCIYCSPYDYAPRKEILKFEEIIDILKIASGLGIDRIRLTGGEPLARKNIETLVKMIKSVASISEVSMTTNGVSLSRKAGQLKEAGLDRVNISLNTLKPDRYRQITGFDYFHQVWNSIETASSFGFDPVKINVILFEGVNDDEILDFVRLTLEKRVCVRFIEYFSTSRKFSNLQKRFVPNGFLRKTIEDYFGKLIPVNITGNGPSENYKLEGASGTIGFIDSNEGLFCNRCNRLRLSSDGKLYSCLFSSVYIDLKKMLRDSVGDSVVAGEIKKLISKKRSYKRCRDREGMDYEFAMREIGG